jgi:hypothetical protein
MIEDLLMISITETGIAAMQCSLSVPEKISTKMNKGKLPGVFVFCAAEHYEV